MYKILHLRPECQKSQCLFAVVVLVENYFFRIKTLWALESGNLYRFSLNLPHRDLLLNPCSGYPE